MAHRSFFSVLATPCLHSYISAIEHFLLLSYEKIISFSIYHPMVQMNFGLLFEYTL